MFIFLFYVNLARSQAPLECGNITTEGDRASLEQFLLSQSLQVAASSNEIPIPLHFIYVNFDNGAPPNGSSSSRLSELIPQVNQYFEDVVSFYVCGYHHINSTSFTHFSFPNRGDLFDTYHVDFAINVYVVNDQFGVGARAAFPWDNVVNNAIWISFPINRELLAHALFWSASYIWGGLYWPQLRRLFSQRSG